MLFLIIQLIFLLHLYVYIFDMMEKYYLNEDFINEYMMFIEHLVMDFPTWRRRFGRLFNKLKYRLEEKIS